MLTCDICFVTSSNRWNLLIHKKSLHTEDTKIVCKECGKEVSNKYVLRNHVNNVHKGVKYKCNICDKEYGDKGTVRKHIRSFHEEKMYPCQMCDYQTKYLWL